MRRKAERLIRDKRRQFSTRTVLLFVLGFASIALLPSILWDFTYDQGTFAYGGTAILNGQRPYIDFWDIKPPNIFYTYALGFAAFGKSVLAIRLLDYLNALLSIGLLSILSARLWKNTPWRNTATAATAVAFVLQYYILGSWNTAQVETYSLPWILFAMLLVVPNRRIKEGRHLALRAVFAGAAIGITVFYKYPNGLFLLLVGAALRQHSGQRGNAQRNALSALLLGFSVTVGLQMFYMWISGELPILWQITTSSTAEYVSNNYSGHFGVAENVRTSISVIDAVWFAAGVFGWGLYAMMLWTGGNGVNDQSTKRRVFGVALLLILAVALGYVIVQFQNKGYAYHYTMLLPWADLLIGAGIGHIARTLHQLDGMPQTANAAIIILLMLGVSYSWTPASILEPRIKDTISRIFGTQGSGGYIATDSIADYVISNTKPTDRIFVFGFAPYVYWKTGRQPANKYLNTIHFKPAYVPKIERDELVHSLTSNPPRLLLVETQDHYTSQGSTNEDSRTTIQRRYPELETLLKDRYVVRDTIQQTIAYFLRDSL